ncbi:MAG TPA: phospholipid carrier-dependent glycosyltransferase [Egibacteraceae bacterium]|nr:phospholipid carrier-dependent glycosyltransferase [Egibacteraceae bacterium]
MAVAVPLLLVLVAGGLRLYLLDHPSRIYFDETYYANDAHEYLSLGVEEDFAVHPPVGKWLLAAGIALFGFDSFGWRFSSAVAGTLTVLVVYLAGLRLFRRRGVAALAAFLLTIEGVAFTASRIAMLDVFLMLFVVTGFWLLLVDRDRQWSGPHREPARPGEAPLASLLRRPHPQRWLAGAALGLALATKWSALLALAAAVLLVVASELTWRKRVVGRPLARAWPAAGNVALTLVALPLAVYLVSYLPWFANFENTRPGKARCPDGVCALSLPAMVGAWWDEQTDIWRFHRDLVAEHPYRASALTWPVLQRPIAYYYESCNDDKLAKGECVVARGNVEEILGLGNPAIWWLGLGAYPLLGWLAVARRDWPAGAILVFLALQYLPWLAATRPVFLFYAAPLVPFLCLGLAYAAWHLGRRPLLGWVPTFVTVMAVAAFLFWYPLYVGLEIPRGAWNLRIWMRSWV